MNYSEAKLRQLDAVGTYRVYGHLVDFDHDTSEEGTARKRWQPVSPCWCVQSSPENPCPCDREIIWWLPIDGIVAKKDSGRKDHRGKELMYFDVRVESTIMMESVQSVSAGTLKSLEANPAFKKFRGLVATTDGFSTPQVIFFWKWLAGAVGAWAVEKLLDWMDDDKSILEWLEEGGKKWQEETQQK